MNKKFSHELFITGSKKELDEIAQALVKMGYEDQTTPTNYQNRRSLLTNWWFRPHHFSFYTDRSSKGSRTRVDAKNKDLVLTLAAMVDEGSNKGEAYVCTSFVAPAQFTRGKIYILQTDCLEAMAAFIDDRGDANGWFSSNPEYFRKATKAEIFEHFNKTMNAAEEWVSTPPKYVAGIDPITTVTAHSVDEDFIKEAHTAACSTWKKKIEKRFPAVFPKKVTYWMGQVFEYNEDKELHILAQVSNSAMALVSLRDGNRFRDAEKVNNVMNITEEEFERISVGKFKLLKGGQMKVIANDSRTFVDPE